MQKVITGQSAEHRCQQIHKRGICINQPPSKVQESSWKRDQIVRARSNQCLLHLTGPLHSWPQQLWLPTQDQVSKYTIMEEKTGHDPSYHSWGAFYSWWLLWEGESVFFKGVFLDRSVRPWWMARYQRVHDHHKSGLKNCWIKKKKEDRKLGVGR